mmetsp:Transcript_4091/g.7037  ORF Transcript_4091/g.7037 Transcript_4091/m.7037 type:complete len:102 (+) Transcript_4091:1829-2134(+)
MRRASCANGMPQYQRSDDIGMRLSPQGNHIRILSPRVFGYWRLPRRLIADFDVYGTAAAGAEAAPALLGRLRGSSTPRSPRCAWLLVPDHAAIERRGELHP